MILNKDNDCENSYYSQWLGKDLLENNFDWSSGSEITMFEFLKKYTLHDSILINLNVYPDQTGIVAIQFDSYWTNGRIPFPGSHVRRWPILLFYFNSLYYISCSHSLYGDSISNAECKIISEENQSELMDKELGVKGEREKCLSKILNSNGGYIEIVHDVYVKILCFDSKKDILKFPDI